MELPPKPSRLFGYMDARGWGDAFIRTFITAVNEINDSVTSLVYCKAYTRERAISLAQNLSFHWLEPVQRSAVRSEKWSYFASRLTKSCLTEQSVTVQLAVCNSRLLHREVNAWKWYKKNQLKQLPHWQSVPSYRCPCPWTRCNS